MSNRSLDRIYTYHPPFGTQQERYIQLRTAAKAFAQLITDLTPPSREQSLALTSVQQTTMWANAAIAITEEPMFHPSVVDQIDGRMLPLTKAQYYAAATAPQSTPLPGTIPSGQPADAQSSAINQESV